MYALSTTNGQKTMKWIIYVMHQTRPKRSHQMYLSGYNFQSHFSGSFSDEDKAETFRVDYCNSMLAGLPTCQLDRIQSVLNSAARLIYGRTPSDHITDLLRDDLHWLRVPQRIVYKLCLVTYKALNDHRMPDYISDFCIRVADKRLRSSSRNLLHVPRSSTKFGDCSFSIAGPTAWNSLPDHVKNASSHLKVS